MFQRKTAFEEMKNTFAPARRMALLLLALLGTYTLCRLLFIYFNRSELNIDSFSIFLNLLWGGLRFDLSVIAMVNLVFAAMILLPFPFVANRHYQRIIGFLFVLLNGIFLLPNLIDVAYFPYTNRRSQSDALLFITGENRGDFFRLLPTFFLQFWYLTLVYLGIIWLLIRVYRKTSIYQKRTNTSLKSILYSSMVFILSLGFMFILIRGGLQAKPLSIIHASEMAEVKNIPAIINSPFSILKTFGAKRVSEIKYYPDDEITRFENGIRRHAPSAPFSNENVVLIIVESLSKKHLGFFGGKAKTPFLDSLFHHGLVFTNAFANAKQSIQGIPAIISSIPSWYDDPFIFSPYVANKITSLPTLLKKQGYQTSFFHGGFNGTMGFDSYSRLSGFDRYYGRNEYGNEKDYDGSWGIWDEPFLQFMAKELDQTKQPFFSTVFTLNTHHPFIIPDKYKNRFNQAGHPLYNSLAYMDYSLSLFFDSIKNKPWYKNTLFVITADHTAPSIENEISSSMDDYRIPIVFYKPNDENFRGTNDLIANQIDILPSILNLLNYPEPYYSIGRSLFDANTSNFAITYNGGIYQYIDVDHCYHFNGENPVSLYHWRSDSLLIKNLYTGKNFDDLLRKDSTVKQMIQFFNQSMLKDRMAIETILPER